MHENICEKISIACFFMYLKKDEWSEEKVLTFELYDDSSKSQCIEHYDILRNLDTINRIFNIF
jgi:hypothetical protein